MALGGRLDGVLGSGFVVGYIQVFSFTGGKVFCSLKAAGLLRGSV